ncbi:MAG: glycosyltransferase family protein [Ignavibacteriales bacterium]|nr:glycosyltransferase family protein [Ignavibacteriales bacterium]MCB9217910.1 glycosyltransferase family protein [Ignavibacteriales bacterium]
MIVKIVTVIQARTGSSRLPDKILLSAAGKQLLLHMVERVKRAKNTGLVVVATTTLEEDDSIEEVCSKNGIECFRGHPTDLLERHYQTAIKYDADIVLKIPSDCPLIDPTIIDLVTENYFSNIQNYDFVSNLRPATFPDGNDVEILSRDVLEYVWLNAKLDYEREHTTPYIWTHPDKFRIGNVEWNSGLDYSKSHRWTLDYEEDYTFIRLIYEELYRKNPHFGMYDIINLIEDKPHLKRINNIHVGKFWHNNYLFNKEKMKANYEQ